MKHVNDGDLRRLIDEPFALAPAVRGHAVDCPECAARMRSIRQNWELVGAAFHQSVTVPDLLSARRRLSATSRERPRAPLWPIKRIGSVRRGVVPGVASLALVAVLGTSVATGAFLNVLTVFQPNQVSPLYIQRSDLTSLSELAHFGSFRTSGHMSSSEVSSVAAADEASGMQVRVPSYLPSGTSPSVMYEVLPAQTASFQFSSDTAAAYARSAGISVPTMPANLNDTLLTLETHSAVVTVYGSKQEVPDLVIGQSGAPMLSVRGATLATVESYLASVPGVPKELVDQLKSLQSPTDTLPIPVPLNLAYAHSVSVDGTSGLAVGDNTGVASVVIWEKAQVVYGVGGAITVDQALQVADSLTS
jgi:hypothetical protein